MKIFFAAAIWLGMVATGVAQTVSPLFARGYTVMPEPQQVSLGANDFAFGQNWKLKFDSSVASNDVAIETLHDSLLKRFNVTLGRGGNSGARVSLRIAKGSVQIGKAQDRDKSALEDQAYKIELHPGSVTITANAETGLFYGVETLVQLLRPNMGTLWLPEGTIVDWPDLHSRHIYWDDNHHLEKMDELKRDLRQAAFYKINGFVIKLNGHFQYKSAPAVVDPYALSPAQLQELTNYGLHYHIELIPYLDGPAHIAFILKHPEYQKLREFPDSNYELCSTNPDSYKLLEGMYQDLLDANKGVKYFYLSTDESYYVGLAHNSQCDETTLAKKLGSVGGVFAYFVDKAGGYLHDHGRTVVFWGEYPLKPSDIPELPSYMVNGEVYGSQFDRASNQHGIRNMIYTSTEGEEKYFPDYFPIPQSEQLHKSRPTSPRIDDIFKKTSFDSSRVTANLIGTFDAGWADDGLHPETFWMGYVASGAVAWHPGTPNPQELMSTFYPLFYGPNVVSMNRIYQMMSEQAQMWSDNWDATKSTARKGIWGRSDKIYEKRVPADDQTLPLPPVPSEDLAYQSTWSKDNADRISLAETAKQKNEVLVGMLNEDITRAQFNRYNLEVFLSIANLCRQNSDMIEGIQHMDMDLASASQLSSKDPQKALVEVDRALGVATAIWRERNQVLQNAVVTWDKSWFPRVPEANGRRFLHELDDVKDHLPDRTVDMTYLVYREKLLPFGTWADSIAAARNKFAEVNHLPTTNYHLAWDDFETTASSCASATEMLANPQLLPADIDQASTCGAGN
ncbi:MAG TPA: glycoside hydrolase family 20 zincin-like fold domain-containing protein [Acidobacteriaceae bacterium]|nr:glycoside hydrolase family 20 zincin-like fold domain-containing protein [Acidobacteriaceae bacterium]